jgi:sugar lactone lactonase YvrE
MIHIEATLAVDACDMIGEGPVWDVVGRRLLWLDNAVGLVHEATSDGKRSWRESKRWNLGRTTGAAVPRSRGGLMVAGGTEIFTLSEAGDTAPFARIDADPQSVKLNDAKCDRQGRLWAGTYAHDFRPGAGALYRIDPDGSVTTVLRDVGLSNGMDWSPDGKTFYYIDSFTSSVDAFDFDAARGTISRRRSVVTVPKGEGGLDGMTIDNEGCLWLAVFGTSEVRRYTADGELLSRVRTTAPNVTSCAFGGTDAGLLFITTAAIRLPDPILPLVGYTAEKADEAAAAPGAGGLFVCRPGVSGLPETPFAG